MGADDTESYRGTDGRSGTAVLVSEEARQRWLHAYGLPHGHADDRLPGAGAEQTWTTSTPRLNRLARMAAAVAEVPFAVVNVITADEQHQIAAFGVDPSVCSREDSMCATVFLDDHPAVVPDASRDPRFRDNPFVTGVIADVRGYVSVPLHAEVPLGSLCVFSSAPATITPDQLVLLENLAENVIDVLELERRDRQLDASLAEAAATAERLEDFARQVSHDLRTPLTSLLGFLELAQEADHEAQAPELLRRADGAGRRMLDSLRDLLDHAVDGSHLESGPVDLGALVHRVQDDVADLAARTGATIECAGGIVRGDESHLRSLVQNLVVNALKYCPADRAPRVRITAVDADGHSGILVEDNGAGIPPADRDRLLREGGRLRRSGEPPGTGLGLGICRHIAEAHGGRIVLGDSALGGLGVRASWPVGAAG